MHQNSKAPDNINLYNRYYMFSYLVPSPSLSLPSLFSLSFSPFPLDYYSWDQERYVLWELYELVFVHVHGVHGRLWVLTSPKHMHT